MKKAAIVFAFLASGICWAQPPADCKPSSLNIPGAPYPCVFPDHRAMFRVAAPDAQKVRVRVGAGFDMTKEADGLWYVTTTPLVEGFHYYMLNIDGASLSDPATQTFFGSGEWSSAIEIPAADADFYSHKDVPHGVVRIQWYFSTVTQRGAAALSTPLPITTPMQRQSIRFSTFCMVGEKTSWAGPSRDTWTRSWIT